MNRRSWIVTFLFLAVIGLALTLFRAGSQAQAAQMPGDGLKPGTACTLFFRGDAAGQSVQSYVASVNNNASIAGNLVSIDDQWIVLVKDKKQFYVPRGVVLVIQVGKD